jgi:hypothetical protein
MSSRLAQLSARRRALAMESQVLRAQLAESANALREALGLVQMGRTVLDGVRRHPGLVVGAAVALVALRPRRVWRLAALAGGTLVFALRAAPALSAAARFFGAARARGAGPRR